MAVATAVLLTLEQNSSAGRARLAGLPLPLRAVLSAQRAGVEEILIVGGDPPARWLGGDRRVQLRWRWIPLGSPDGPTPEVAALRRVAPELTQPFVLLFADSLFEAQALSELRAAGLEGKMVRVAVPRGGPEEPAKASLYLCSPELFPCLRDATGDEDLDSFAARLHQQGRSEAVPVSGRLWPRTSDPRELRRIHRELTRFHLKPSDGIFARFNKLVVAEPLIRLFLRTRATPNFITGLGLLLAVASGGAFVQGSYAWSLLGALLAYFSALLDHVDGMVARLKFLESEFGVWFESAADVTSYLCIFSGMAVGLYRETGFFHHLVVGGLFVLGTVASLITTSWQRRLASADNPSDYVNRIRSKLEERSENVFHWFTRKCYFLTRRAVLPFFILIFCLLDWRALLLGWVTLGSHVVWILTLYNNRLFLRSRPASTSHKVA
ncbi:MAG: CDP-alcohol phosphatidyltransferase family protein [Terriglobia bacterium]